DPADRYQSPKVMAAEIDAVLGDSGYPESNDQIATFLAAMAAPASPPRPAQILGAVSSPAQTVGAAPPPVQTLGAAPPPAKPPAPPRATGKQRHAPQPPSNKRHATASGGKTVPLPSVAPSKATDSAADTMPTLPPAAAQPLAAEPPIATPRTQRPA